MAQQIILFLIHIIEYKYDTIIVFSNLQKQIYKNIINVIYNLILDFDVLVQIIIYINGTS